MSTTQSRRKSVAVPILDALSKFFVVLMFLAGVGGLATGADALVLLAVLAAGLAFGCAHLEGRIEIYLGSGD